MPPWSANAFSCTSAPQFQNHTTLEPGIRIIHTSLRIPTAVGIAAMTIQICTTVVNRPRFISYHAICPASCATVAISIVLRVSSRAVPSIRPGTCNYLFHREGAKARQTDTAFAPASCYAFQRNPFAGLRIDQGLQHRILIVRRGSCTIGPP